MYASNSTKTEAAGILIGRADSCQKSVVAAWIVDLVKKRFWQLNWLLVAY